MGLIGGCIGDCFDIRDDLCDPVSLLTLTYSSHMLVLLLFFQSYNNLSILPQ